MFIAGGGLTFVVAGLEDATTLGADTDMMTLGADTDMMTLSADTDGMTLGAAVTVDVGATTFVPVATVCEEAMTVGTTVKEGMMLPGSVTSVFPSGTVNPVVGQHIIVSGESKFTVNWSSLLTCGCMSTVMFCY